MGKPLLGLEEKKNTVILIFCPLKQERKNKIIFQL